MRFYFQDAGQKVATKCVNVTSAQTTKQVIDILIAKFRPDMRMLSVAEYGLYEIHENGDERKLDPEEKPLFIQLGWNQDDRDGRFLLRKIAEKSHDLTSQQESSLKKQDFTSNGSNNIAATLYKDVPQTSLTRSISNPEAVMKRRRALKLEKKLHDLEGGQDGGTLRIFGEAIDKKVSYKTLLLSTKDKASMVVRQVLEKYGKENENPANYCLVCVVINSLADGETSLRETILSDEDRPLLINQNHNINEGVLTFHVRPKTHRRNGTLPRQFLLNEPVETDCVPHNNNNNHIPDNNNHHINGMKQLPQQMVPRNHFLVDSQQTHSLPHLPRHQPQHPPQYIHATSKNDPILPALIQVKEDLEDIFLSRVITQIEPAATQFRLAPTYVLYMVSRYRASTLFHPELHAPERAKLFEPFTRKIAGMIRSAIEFHKSRPAHLAFWLANTSDLNHFYKQDKHLSHFTIDAQKILYDSITSSFQYLLHCKQEELDRVLLTFFSEADDSGYDASLGRHIPKTGADAPVGPILDVLEDTMATLRKNRVNAALTIQIFSHLFHHISRWLFDRLIGVYDRHPSVDGWQANFAAYCNQHWGLRFSNRLAMIRGWAEKQGLEQAADFHLARVFQVTVFLSWQYPQRITPQDVREVCDKCDRLNPVQLRALLQRYQPEQQNLINIIRNIVFSMDYSYVASEYPLEEDFELKMPFLIPDDGYSSEMIRFLPKNLIDFVEKLSSEIINNQPLCIFTVQPTSSGFWNVYFKNSQPDTPEIIMIQLRKVNDSMGLSIIGAKGSGRLGIYIKNVVKNGAAALDGRLQAGDQLLEVDGNSLQDIDQETAAALLKMTGPIITLKIAKQAATYHNLPELNDILRSQPPIGAPPIVAPPKFIPPPPREVVRQVQIPERRQVPTNQIHQNVPLPVSRFPPQPEIPMIPRMMQFQNDGHTGPTMDKFTMHTEIQQQIQPERHVNFQPPPPAMIFDDPLVTPPTHPLHSATSPLKSPKKVSWVDTQPHQSLHTLIPPSPAPLPSPTAQEPSPTAELTNGQDYDEHEDEDESKGRNPEENPLIDAMDTMRLQDDFENRNHQIDMHQMQPQQQHYDEEAMNIIHQSQHQHEEQSEQEQPQNGQLETTTESFTLEDIDEVLGSENHNNWPEDSSGVIGTQEVYNDPRQRIVKERERPNAEANTEKLSFKEKLKMFNESKKIT